ncbi:hypothetical protein CROQUDRAFT_206180 [Cronartium quercuum f. sp. fusiforme G11]|uniref:Uncharacterized protein n=1 Tax=Cronartium quercuum f. sp. fusiforme G11 TaxID=708437 RepID=A0A9P6NAH7_9BASI|nr:hypothetical protein CROQUDRAFT_206180 [Cronartium quercuum f. sp. fusiforme G11]
MEPSSRLVSMTLLTTSLRLPSTASHLKLTNGLRIYNSHKPSPIQIYLFLSSFRNEAVAILENQTIMGYKPKPGWNPGFFCQNPRIPSPTWVSGILAKSA